MFMKLIDQLPTGPEWQCGPVHVRGDAVIPRELGDAKEDESEDEVEGEGEELELWLQDPVACVQELIGNAAFKNEMAYAPEKVYTDLHSKTRHYDEMWTGNWWWETQVGLCETPCQQCTLTGYDSHSYQQGPLYHPLFSPQIKQNCHSLRETKWHGQYI